MKLFDVFDTPENFNTRALGKYVKDDMSDAHYSVLVKQYPELFAIVPKADMRNLPPFPSPRSHDTTAGDIRAFFAKNGGMPAIAA